MFEQAFIQPEANPKGQDSNANPDALSQLLHSLSGAGSNTAEQWIEQLIFELPIAILVIDSEGRVAYSNQLADRWLDKPLHCIWSDVIENRFAPKADDGYEISLKDGRRMHVTTQAIQSLKGQIIAISDLTESRAYQLRKNQTERLQVLGQMMASLAHQVRTPLASALLYAGHLTNKKIGDDKRIKYAEKVLKHLNQTNQQINDMLMYAQGDELIVEEISVQRFLDILMNNVIPEGVLSIQNSHLDHVFNGNAELLLGAFQNLVNNAIEASDNIVSIQLKVSIKKDQVVFSIKDNGPGIEKKHLDKILDPFFTTKAKGTGLGLPVVKKIIEAHQGSFEIDGRVKTGTLVKISLPISKK